MSLEHLVEHLDSDMDLSNADIAPVPANKRDWKAISFFTLWVGMAVNIPSYMIAASLIDGGMSWQHTLELMDNVPGLKLIYDTGNSPFMKDFSKGGDVWQDGWEFYLNVKQHIVYIHIKDTLNPVDGGKETYTMPGEGQGQ